jgi:hypothetical protein
LSEAFALLERCFDEALARWGGAEHTIGIAGRCVRLQFAGEGLLDQILPAFAHLRLGDPPARADLTVRIWDTSSTGVDLPESKLLPRPGDPPVLPTYRSSSFCFSYQRVESALSFLDIASASALYCASGVGRLAPWEKASPLRLVLNWWLQTEALQLVHSAAVGRPGGGVLLTGRSGSGKSTTALLCLQAGLRYAGDDYVLLQSDPPFVHSIYASAKLEATQRARHPDLLPGLVHMPSGEEKCIGLLDGPYSALMASGFPATAVLLPTVTNRPATRLVETSPANALLALGPATLLQLPGDSTRAMDVLTDLLRRRPSFVLELGRDMERIPTMISALLAELGVP